MKIRLYEHPLAVVAPQEFEVDNLAVWLLDHYGDTPQFKLQIFTGEPSAETEITDDVRAILSASGDEYVILQSPGEGISTLMWIYIAFIAAVVIFMPKPEMPSNLLSNRTQSSPNNALGSRQNKVRMLERVEDIYGTVKSTPSLMMPTYNKYIGHEKFEYGYYCVGRGYYDIEDVKDGETLIADITGASAAVYQPFTSPNSAGAPQLQVGDAIIDKVATVSRAIEVDGITLKALNQLQLPASSVYTFAHGTGGDTITQANKTPNFNAICAVGDKLAVTMSNYAPTGSGSISVVGATHRYYDSNTTQFAFIEVGDTVIFSGFVTAANNGSFLVTAKTVGYDVLDTYTPGYLTVATGTQVDETAGPASFTIAPRNYSGSYVISAVNDGSVVLTSTAWGRSIPIFACSVQLTQVLGGVDTPVSEWTDWVTMPVVDRAEVWCNVTAPNGMFADSGGKSSVTSAFEIQIEQLNPATFAATGIVESITGSLSGAVSDERAETIEQVTAWAGPCRVRMRRTTQYSYGFNGSIQDEIKWSDLYSVSPVSKTEFGNKTTIQTITKATARSTAVKSRQLNCIASRKLPIYNGATFSGAFDSSGLHTTGTIAATSKLVDIIAAISIDGKIGARDLATEVDMAQIYGVQEQLDAWSSECGQFNYTLDSDNLSFEETLMLIANAGFCTAYRQNGKIRLALDREQTASTALFTHRNKKPKSETITRKFSSDSDYDGVEFVYVDPDSQQSETITLPLNGAYTKLKKFEIAGIRSFDQAWYRACREYAKLLGQRITIETTTTLDGRSLLPNTRIDVVDNTRFKSYDGEVVGQSGLTLTLSRDVAFAPGESHSIVLMRRDGSLQSITCTAGAAANQVVLASLPAEAIVTSYGQDGIRTIFSFAADSARDAMAWLVQEVDITDGQYCTIKAINYSADYYASDTEAVPAKEAVIN